MEETKTLSKRAVIEKMRDEIPFHLNPRTHPYIEEALDIYAKQVAIDLLKWAMEAISQDVSSDDSWVITDFSDEHQDLSNDELYELYLQSKK